MTTRKHQASPDGVIARYRTAGGATVALHPTRFTTKWDYRGAPYAATTPYEVGGWNWRCLGCGEYGREGDSYNDPGFCELREARADAQVHAEKRCAMPPTDHEEPAMRPTLTNILLFTVAFLAVQIALIAIVHDLLG